MGVLLEVIGFNVDACVNAQTFGADRVELCASPGEGGTTPSLSFIKIARKILQIPLYAMVRPRGGDFLYSENEFQMMMEDVANCKNLGCDGVVIGALDKNGDVDLSRCARLVEMAYPMGVTFHRAFDRVKDYKKALREVISLGCERILTSGLRPSCIEGIEIIRDLIRLADGDIVIMPGSGVRSSNIREIITSTGATEIHSSASVNVPSAMSYRNELMKEDLYFVSAGASEIRGMKDALQTL